MARHVTVATTQDLEAVWQLYVDVCEHQAVDSSTPLWKLGIHPSKEDIAEHIVNGNLYALSEPQGLIGVMVLGLHDDPEYVSAPWPSGATGADVCTIHLLAVHPSQRGKGIGRELVREAISLARAWGKRAIHLDVVPSNVVASRMYLDEGFTFVCSWQVWYPDTGTMDFDLYELAL